MSALNSTQARDFVARMARVRVYSGAIGYEDVVLAEGNVMSYIDAPSIELMHDDGKLKSWSTSLRVEEVDQRTPGTERDFLSAVVRARMQRGWSQEHLAAALRAGGISSSQSEVSRIERGQQALLIGEAIVLADLLGVELHIGGGTA
jgi:hypothetical protein